nr:4-(cytidine 5'-diphospho)-2-C-methyl-D-erythritol kinase [Heliomarina baculiformis]
MAPAKINLSLHVTGRRDDGYHLLDSLVVFADICDRLWLSGADEMSLSVTGPFAEGVPEDGRNLVWQAAERAGRVLSIRLEKNLPHGAGIGGGSSDAAAVLRWAGAGEHALDLGADVPVCLSQTPQRMRGIGEQLDPVAVPECHLVLVNPAVHVPTPAVFRALERRDNAAMTPMADDFVGWLGDQRNDLQEAAISVAPVIAEALAALDDALVARMSGSGATCFGLYPDANTAKTSAERIAAARPGWWVRACRSFDG